MARLMSDGLKVTALPLSTELFILPPPLLERRGVLFTFFSGGWGGWLGVVFSPTYFRLRAKNFGAKLMSQKGTGNGLAQGLDLKWSSSKLFDLLLYLHSYGRAFSRVPVAVVIVVGSGVL